MSRTRFAILAAALALTVGGVLFILISHPPDDVIEDADDDTVTFQSVSSLPKALLHSTDTSQHWFRIQVDGNQRLIKAGQDFPASVFMHPPCSATLIGEHVLLTAAHCLGSRRRAALKLADGQKTRGPCTIYQEGASPDFSVDIALCRMETAISNIVFESLPLPNDSVNVNDEVMLTGFGANKAFKEAFLTGMTKVSRIDGSILVTNDQTFTTNGDSGGAVYRIVNGDRRVIGVNSRVASPESFATFVIPVKSTILDWQKQASAALTKNVFICGYDDNPACRLKP